MSIGQKLSTIVSDGGPLWQTRVGRMHYRNSIVHNGDTILVSTSGTHWNVADSRDGVYAIDLRNGQILWHAHTQSDANGISVSGQFVLGATDNGQAFALDIQTGEMLSSFNIGSAIYTKPIAISNGGERLQIFLSYVGHIIAFSEKSQSFKNIGNLQGTFRTDPVSDSALAANGSFVVASEEGEIFNVSISNNEPRYDIIYKLSTSSRVIGRYKYNLSLKGIGSLKLHNDQLIVSYIRDTFDETPPILCINIKTNQKIWDAAPLKTISTDKYYGNARCIPTIYKDQFYTTFGYTDGIYSFSLQNGRATWKMKLDDGMLQNWASPLLKGDHIFVPRVNGVVHEVDLENKKLLSSRSIEIGRYIQTYMPLASENIQSDSEASRPISGERPHVKSGPYPQEILDAGIASTPVMANNFLLVGTVSGFLRCYST